MKHLFLIGWLTLVIMSSVSPAAEPTAKATITRVSIADGKWRLNGEVAYRGTKAEGLLMNVRMVNAVFEDATARPVPRGSTLRPTRMPSSRRCLTTWLRACERSRSLCKAAIPVMKTP